MNVCAVDGCPTLTPKTRCTDHNKKQQQSTRAQYPRGTYGAEWPSISRRYRHQHPTCECLNPTCKCIQQCAQPSTETDHIIPLNHFTTRAAAHHHTNLQALCKQCHSHKTANETLHPTH